MPDTILLKLGGSVITDKSKPFTVDYGNLRRIASEIHDARCERDFRLVVANGAGSFAHVSAKKYRTNEGIVDKKSCEGIAVVQNDAARLNRIVVEELLKTGENAVSIQPSAGVIAKNSEIVQWDLQPMKAMMNQNMVPVAYGDVAFDLEKGCCILSAEEVLRYIGKNMGANIFVAAGRVDGVFTSDPHKDPDAKLIPEISMENFEGIKHMLGGSAGIDVTGGMLHKVEKMIELSKYGIRSLIVNAQNPGELKESLLHGVSCTVVRP